MKEDDTSSVDRLNDTLYSRTDYVPPDDRRSPVHTMPENDIPEQWETPSLDDMIKERRSESPEPTRMKKFFVVSILFFVGAFVVAGYVYLVGGNFVSTKNVDIKITGPAAIEAGVPLVMTITVENNNNAELQSANLSIQYPEGTRQVDNATAALTRDRIAIGSIGAGGESVQTFKSTLFGQKGDIKTLKLFLEYKIKGSSAVFYKNKTFEITIGDTPIAIGIERPTSVTSDVGFITKILIASNSTEVLKDVIVKAEYPYGFSVIDSEPATASGNNIWVVGDLAPGAKKVIQLKGSISGIDDEERTFRFYAGLAETGSPNNLKNPLVSMTETVRIARPSVGLSISMNGETDGDHVAPAGGTISTTIFYQNNATEKLTRPRISVKLTGSSLDKATIRPGEGGFYDSNSGLVVWEAPGSSNLVEISPGSKGVVTLSFASLQTLPSGKSQEIGLQAVLTGVPGGLASADPLNVTASKSVKISSTVNLTGKALYSRGPYKNVGPLPPKAEATTTYSVILGLGNTQNDVENAIVTAKLGANVKFLDGGNSGDTVTYDAASNTVTWNVGSLVSGTGFTLPGREVVFQVALKPSIGQIGTVPTLVSGISFRGTDTFINAPVSASVSPITTRLISDSKFVQGDETVVK